MFLITIVAWFVTEYGFSALMANGIQKHSQTLSTNSSSPYKPARSTQNRPSSLSSICSIPLYVPVFAEGNVLNTEQCTQKATGKSEEPTTDTNK